MQKKQQQKLSVRNSIPKPLQILPKLPQDYQPHFAKFGIQKLILDYPIKSKQQLSNNNKFKLMKVKVTNQSLTTNFPQITYLKFMDLDNKNFDLELPQNFLKCNIENFSKKPIQIENQYHINILPQLQNITFNSKFQSGNLSMVSKINQNQYNLLLNNDINTEGFSQWFFFKVTIKKKTTIKFNILNFRKQKSLFQKGMKICYYSKKQNELAAEGWKRGGIDINYFQNTFELNRRKVHYTLSWKFSFQHANDEIYFSYHYPYTYSKLNKFYETLQNYSHILKRNLLCKTLLDNRVQYLTITDNNSSNQSKKIVILIARTHAGQTISSFIIQNIIKYLISDEKQANQLRTKFVFKIIPMLNPDGVINGNSRCSLVGRDINRSWLKSTKQKFPEIYYLRKLILDIDKKTPIFLICDFHGHSAKKDSFIYGCHNKNSPFSTRQFPWILAKINKNFNFYNCSFSTAKSKQGTARISLWRLLKIANIFTLQTSFCGSSKSNYHWNEQDFKELGKSFCLAINILNPCKDSTKNRKNYSRSKSRDNSDLMEQNSVKQKFLEQLYSNEQNYKKNLNDESASESDIQNDYIKFSTINLKKNTNNIMIKKKITKHESMEVDKIKFNESFEKNKNENNKVKKFEVQDFSRQFERVQKSEINSYLMPVQEMSIYKKISQKNSSKNIRKPEFDNIRFWISNKLNKLAHNNSFKDSTKIQQYLIENFIDSKRIKTQNKQAISPQKSYQLENTIQSIKSKRDQLKNIEELIYQKYTPQISFHQKKIRNLRKNKNNSYTPTALPCYDMPKLQQSSVQNSRKSQIKSPLILERKGQFKQYNKVNSIFQVKHIIKRQTKFTNEVQDYNLIKRK